MPRRRKERMRVTRVEGVGDERVTRTVFDELIVEEPMTIQLDGAVVSTTMRTPGHDFELAAGFCFAEGLLGAATVTGVRYCAGGSAVDTEFNVVTVETGGRAAAPTARLGTVSSSCGWCGSEQLDALCERLDPLPASEPFDIDVLASMPQRMSTTQGLFAATGAVHAAAAFDRSGAVLVIREDVGRHNAVDKVVGSMLLAAHVARLRSRALRQWAGEHRDGAEGVGRGVLDPGRGECADRARRRRRSPGRHDAGRLRPRRRLQRLRAGALHPGRFWACWNPNRPLMHRLPWVIGLSGGEVTFTMVLSCTWSSSPHPTPQKPQIVSVTT